MQGYEQQHIGTGGPQLGPQAGLQKGVREFMTGVYAWMAAGVGVSALVAWGLSQSMAAMQLMYGSFLGTVVIFAPLILALFLPGRIPGMSRGAAAATFVGFAALLGAGLSYIPLMMAGSMEFQSVVVQAFVTTVGIFGGMAFFGFVTKKDLSGIGQFLVMAIIGAIIASVINMFMHSAGMSYAISVIVAIAAAGLTAYHTQAIKQIYLVNGGRGNLAILGALALYVDFVNLFLSLLRLFAASRD